MIWLCIRLLLLEVERTGNTKHITPQIILVRLDFSQYETDSKVDWGYESQEINHIITHTIYILHQFHTSTTRMDHLYI